MPELKHKSVTNNLIKPRRTFIQTLFEQYIPDNNTCLNIYFAKMPTLLECSTSTDGLNEDLNLAPSTVREHCHSVKIFKVLWELKKRGYAEKTIEGYFKRLKMLSKHIDLDNSEAVKAFIAN